MSGDGADDGRLAKFRKQLLEWSRPRNQAGIIISINGGDGVAVGDGSSVSVIKTEKVVHRPQVTVTPGEEHITEEQVATLHELVDEIVRVEALTKRRPATYQAVWSSLNKKMRVGTMRLIPLEKYPSARKYLQMWLGRIGGTPTAFRRDEPAQRKRLIAYIQTNMKKKDIEERVRAYMRRHMDAASLTELSIQGLERVKRCVAGIKPKT